MYRLYITVLVFTVFNANAEIHSNHQVTFTSNYISDGFSQTLNDPALQYGLQLNDDKTYYRLFISNLKSPLESGQEFDLGIGTAFEHAWGTIDLGLLNNFNFGMADTDRYFYEIYLGLKLPHEIESYFTYSDDHKTFDGAKNAKITLAQSFAINESVSWRYLFGYADMFRSRIADSEYIWWRLDLNYTWANWQWQLAYTNTDVEAVRDPDELAQEHVFVSASHSF